jgi:hypothetical protein
MMMGKTRQGRFDDTVTYIRNYAACGLNQVLRNDIANMVIARIPRTNPAQIQAYNTLSDSMSVADNIGVGMAKGTQAERHQRRAIVLLWSALAATQPFPPSCNARIADGMNLAPGALAARLNETMRRAVVVASPAGAAHVFNMEFAANPLAFIQANRIFIHGGTAGEDLLTNPGAHSFANVLNFVFCYNTGNDRFEFHAVQAPQIHGQGHSFQTASVPALHWSDVPGRGPVPLPVALDHASFAGMLGINMTGAQWMVTTQFTGCSFCYSRHGGSFFAAHITPAGIAGKPILTGGVLAKQIMGNENHVAAGRLANFPGGGPAPALNVFGNGAGNVIPYGGGNGYYPPKTLGAGPGQMKWMSIFGRNHNGAWEIYTQSVDGADAIMEARRIV